MLPSKVAQSQTVGKNMAQLGAVVKAGRADIGFAHDADGERLGIVTELGQPLSEELTFALATRIRLEQKTGTVVTNVSTTGAVEQIAAVYGGTVVRTQVGTAVGQREHEHIGDLAALDLRDGDLLAGAHDERAA